MKIEIESTRRVSEFPKLVRFVLDGNLDNDIDDVIVYVQYYNKNEGRVLQTSNPEIYPLGYGFGSVDLKDCEELGETTITFNIPD